MVYYPEDLRVLQRVTWKENLLPAAQHDEFRPTIRGIMHQCRVLHQFHLGSVEPPADDRGGDEHLLTRAQTRRNAFRALQHEQTSPEAQDRIYVARDCARSAGCLNTYESVSLIQKWSRGIPVNPDLSATLQEWPSIQGFPSKFELYLLADLINVNLAANWGSLFALCQSVSKSQGQFRIMFLFATMSFNPQVDMTIMRTLIAIAILEDFQTLQLPCHPSFTHFRRGQIPDVALLVHLMKPYRTPYPEDERALLSVAMHSKQRRKLEMAQSRHEDQSEDSCKTFARHLLSQWPVHEPSISSLCLEDLPLLDAERALVEIKPEWGRQFANYELSEHLTSVQNILKACRAVQPEIVSPVRQEEQHFYPMHVLFSVRPTLQALLRKLSASSHVAIQLPTVHHLQSAQPKPNEYIATDSSACATGSLMTSNIRSHSKYYDPPKARSSDWVLINELKNIVQPFADSDDPVRRAYGRDLQSSIRALEMSKDGASKELVHATSATNTADTAASILSSLTVVNDLLGSFQLALKKNEPWLAAGALLPDITPVSLLEMLRPSRLPKQMSIARDSLIDYGESISNLQHELRIQGAALRRDMNQLANETQATSHRKWQARDHPDWLLLEIDFNIRIRPDQHEVAVAMTSSSGKGSFCLQMNMGQGKSSIIIPMVVAQLADKNKLVRVVVPRPLLLQAAQLLQARIGGLIGRKVKHLPFSRRSSTAINNIDTYRNLHLQILEVGGIILTLPEHMLSFQLSGLQELSNNNIKQSATMIRFQEWLTKNCRDILDECDHMLAVKTQLIYPSGAQTMVDGHPTRWKIVQDVLKLVKAHLGPLRREYPRSLEVIERSRGAFPTVYLLTPEVKNALMHRLTNSVVGGEGGILPMDCCSLDEKVSVNLFLRDAQFPAATAMKIAGAFKGNPDARQRLLLLRGLFVHKILLLGLNKRWNVQYGIDTRRDPIAVPYKAKGIASDQAEFGHPDVSIILTCLSFYYSGLTLPQFRQALMHLIKSDDEPVREFDSWIHTIPAFPESLRSWNSIK